MSMYKLPDRPEDENEPENDDEYWHLVMWRLRKMMEHIPVGCAFDHIEDLMQIAKGSDQNVETAVEMLKRDVPIETVLQILL